MKKYGFKMAAALFVLALTLCIAPDVQAGGNVEPPGPGERLAGPAIPAHVTLVFNNDADESSYGTVKVHISGRCKGYVVSGSIDKKDIQLPFGDITADDLMDMRLNFDGSGSPCDSGALISNAVISFSNDGSVINADVIFLYVVAK